MKQDPTIARTPNMQCPACLVFRLHTDEERKTYHPNAGTGHSREHGKEARECKTN